MTQKQKGTSPFNNSSSVSMQKKLHQQNEIIEKLKSEESKLILYVQEFKQALKRKSLKEDQSVKKCSQLDEQKLQKQLQKEVENAKTMLKNYQHQLRNLQKKNNKLKYTPEDLMQLEEQVKAKEIQLKQCQQQIKDLGIVKRKQQKLIEKKQKNEDGVKLAKLVQEVRKQRELVNGLKEKNLKKQEQLERKKNQIKELESKYTAKCKQMGQTPLNFQQFKERRKQKRREEASQSLRKEKNPQKKKIITVKEMINHQLESENIEPTEKNYKQLKVKKQVAQNSLKLAQRKDEKQMQNLKERVEKLKQENVLLEQKLAQKMKEREMTSNVGVDLESGLKSKGSNSKIRNSSINKSHNNNTHVKLDPINK